MRWKDPHLLVTLAIGLSMQINLSITEAKYLCLKALGVTATLKSRGGVHILQTEAEIEIYGTVEEGTGRCQERVQQDNQERLPV